MNPPTHALMARLEIRRIGESRNGQKQNATLNLRQEETIHPEWLVGVGTHLDIHGRWKGAVLLRIKSINKQDKSVRIISGRKFYTLKQNTTFTLHHKRYGSFVIKLIDFVIASEVKSHF